MSTPTETALARRWRLEINMGTVAVPDWQLCPAITEFQWTAEPNLEDDTSYDTDGWGESTKTGQDWEVEVTFNRKASPDSTVYSTVHEAIRTAFFAYGDLARIVMDCAMASRNSASISASGRLAARMACRRFW